MLALAFVSGIEGTETQVLITVSEAGLGGRALGNGAKPEPDCPAGARDSADKRHQSQLPIV